MPPKLPGKPNSAAGVAERDRSIRSNAAMRDATIAVVLGTRNPRKRARPGSIASSTGTCGELRPALSDYDVRLHHPHPPGYPVFIAPRSPHSDWHPDPGNAALVTVAMILSALQLSHSTERVQRCLIARQAVLPPSTPIVSVTFGRSAAALAYAWWR